MKGGEKGGEGRKTFFSPPTPFTLQNSAIIAAYCRINQLFVPAVLLLSAFCCFLNISLARSIISFFAGAAS